MRRFWKNLAFGAAVIVIGVGAVAGVIGLVLAISGLGLLLRFHTEWGILVVGLCLTGIAIGIGYATEDREG